MKGDKPSAGRKVEEPAMQATVKQHNSPGGGADRPLEGAMPGTPMDKLLLHPHRRRMGLASRGGRWHDHHSLIPVLVAHCRSHAAATSQNEEAMFHRGGRGTSNRWLYAMESMEVPMPLPVSLPAYSETH
jgi:hypothetical protein